MYLHCVFLDKKVKIVISNMAAITQQAIVEKRASESMFYLSVSPYSCFGLNLRHMVMPHMCCEMQN